ncbi:hypothetical protein GH714_016087 [Hevea brasiliensis]|uniref:Protein FAR1-RELATED SEQUENCE n=1 Tax=Hevea brasiliensis TaxID=3981 RepID=A0A6A6L6I5_HEVBR|nr:hypothetical protein GH714_016087 [Hevea brasiliensis]
MEVENERRRRELYDTLGIRDDDSLFDANSLSDEPSNGTNGTPSHGYEEGPIEESQSGSDGQCSNVHENEIPYNVEEGPKTGMHFPTMDDLVNFYKHHARLKGFSIVIRSSSKGNSLVPKYVLITCDKGSKPHSGCALLSREDVETFKWVFSIWLSAMVDIHPYAILTDQCESIRAAIREVMPETRHRFCLWHILSKVSEKFKGVEDFTKATNEFKALIFDSLMIEMFETNWNNFLMKYGQENNEWLMKLYFERENWVPIY